MSKCLEIEIKEWADGSHTIQYRIVVLKDPLLDCGDFTKNEFKNHKELMKILKNIANDYFGEQ